MFKSITTEWLDKPRFASQFVAKKHISMSRAQHQVSMSFRSRVMEYRQKDRYLKPIGPQPRGWGLKTTLTLATK